MATATITKSSQSTARKRQTSTTANSEAKSAPDAEELAAPLTSSQGATKRIVTKKCVFKKDAATSVLAPNDAQITQGGTAVGPVDAAAQEDLSSTQRTRFVTLSKLVRVGLKKMNQLSLEVAEALREIRDEELYLGSHKNFREYCLAELNLFKSQAYALAKAGGVQRDIDSAMADKSMLPKNERQLRPLTKLKTREERVKAWQCTLEIAGSKPVTEADVRKVKALFPVKSKLFPLSNQKPAGDWKAGLVTKFNVHGYEHVFEQPFKWPSDVANLYSGERQQHVRFVDTLNFNESAGALALKQNAGRSLIIISADANAPDGVLFSKGGAPFIERKSFPPAFHFMAKQLDAVLEQEGVLYRAGELDDSFETEWTPVAYADLGLPNLDNEPISGANED